MANTKNHKRNATPPTAPPEDSSFGGSMIRVVRVGDDDAAAEGVGAKIPDDTADKTIHRKRVEIPTEFMDLLYYTSPETPPPTWMFTNTHGVRLASKSSLNHSKPQHH